MFLVRSLVACRVTSWKHHDSSRFIPRRPRLQCSVFVAAAKDGTAGAPNLQLHDVKTGKCLKSFIQKKMQNW